jgi:hypothetical protein
MMRRRAALLAVVLTAVAWARTPAQQQPATLSPEAPADGASVGKKPRFLLRSSGPDVDRLRFRIELSKDAFKTIAYRFDQLKDENGWAYTELEDKAPGAVFFTRQPLDGGAYVWRVASWDGLSWKDGDATFRLQVDDVAPADVDGVVMSRDARTNCIHVHWAPVVTDVDGQPERMGIYRVYRYASKGPTRPVRPFEVGTTATLDLDDCDQEALTAPLLFYRIVGQDEAGNLPGRRY